MSAVLLALCYDAPARAEESPKQAAKSVAGLVPVIANEQKHRKETLDDIEASLGRLEPEEIEKAAGLRKVVEEGQPKYYLADKLLESLPTQVLEALNVKLLQTEKQVKMEELKTTEERRKALDEMMEARRFAMEESERQRR